MSRVIGFFPDRDALFEAIADARVSQLKVITALLPTFDAEAIEAVGVGRSWAGAAATAGAVIGAAAGLLFPAWAVRQWPHVMVSGKPLLSWPTFLIISFEVMLLCGALAAFSTFVIVAWRSRRLAGSIEWSQAARSATSDAAYALVIGCPASRTNEVAGAMRARGAVECAID